MSTEEKHEEIETASSSSKVDIDEKIVEICHLLDDPSVDVRKKAVTVITIPKDLDIGQLTPERCEKLFGSLEREVLECVLHSEEEEVDDAKPIVAHIVSFCCQSTSLETYSKFKPIVPDLVQLIPKSKCALTTSTLNDIAIILTYMPFLPNERHLLYDSLRYITSYFINQKSKLEINEFLSIVRLVLSKIFSVVSVINDGSLVDSKGWSVGILSILRNLLREKPENMDENARIGMWDVIGSVSRLIGPRWFSLDITFAKLVAQLNTVELQMCLHKPGEIISAKFARHLRIIEVFIAAVQDDDVFNRAGLTNDIFLTIGTGVKYVLQFWSEAAAVNEDLSNEVKLNLFTFAVFLLSRGEMEIVDEKVQKQLGPLILTQAITILEMANDNLMVHEIAHLYTELFEKMSDILTLDDRVPVLAANFLVKIRETTDRPQWKVICLETTMSLVDLRGRVDWYSIRSIEETKRILETLNEDDQHDVTAMISMLEKLPRVK